MPPYCKYQGINEYQTTWPRKSPSASRGEALLPHLHAVHGHCGEIVGILLVPAESQQWVVLGVLVDDGAVLQVPQVEHPHRAVGAHRGKHVPAATRAAEGDVVHLPHSTARLARHGLGAVHATRPPSTSCSLQLLSYSPKGGNTHLWRYHSLKRKRIHFPDLGFLHQLLKSKMLK